jgi:hypothetical protein
MHPVMVAPGKAEKKSGEGKKGEWALNQILIKSFRILLV